MRSNLRTHPKVVRIASALKADRLRVIGGLHAVWCLFDEHSEDGCLVGYTPDSIDDLIGWPGFTDQLLAVDWVGWDGAEGLFLPEFDTHNGASAKRRAQEADRKRAERAAEKDVGKSSAGDADKKRTREEKRREEITEPKGSVGRASRKCPGSFVLTDEMREWAASECPGVNVERETEKLRDHTFKTARTNWAGVWRNWMREASDRLRGRGAVPAARSFAASDREAGMQRWEQMTGRTHPDRVPSGQVIDADTAQIKRISA